MSTSFLEEKEAVCEGASPPRRREAIACLSFSLGAVSKAACCRSLLLLSCPRSRERDAEEIAGGTLSKPALGPAPPSSVISPLELFVRPDLALGSRSMPRGRSNEPGASMGFPGVVAGWKEGVSADMAVAEDRILDFC